MDSKITLKNQFVYLDLLRGVAAILVFIGHLRALMFSSDISKLNIFGDFFYFITGFGHQAVMIFFVLSGFFISRSVINSIENNSWSFKVFLFNRLSRLWIVLIPALLIGGFIDLLGLSFLENTIVYQDKIPFLKTITSFSQLSISSFLETYFSHKIF
jgi:peptidoglycan/LPS O-acetylase OafA/YrhL